MRTPLRIKRAGLMVAALLASYHLSFAESEPKPETESSKPNILFLFADDWGWGDLSCHGHKDYKTPNLDKLASQGTEFSQFTVSAAVCSPSRAAVLTGQFPARHSIHQHFSDPEHNKKCGMPDWLDPNAVLLPRLLQEAGYKTAHFGKWHLTNTGCDDAPVPTEYGYDETGVFNGPGPQINPFDSSTYDRTIAFMEKHKDDAFFIHVSMHEPHTPHAPKDEYLKKFEHLDIRHQVYAAILAEADHNVGRILQALDDLGLADNTLVVFSSDNGPESATKRNPPMFIEGVGQVYGMYYSVGSAEKLKGRKRSLFEGGVRVPCFVRWPGKTPVGAKDDTAVITAVDLLPTFCKAAGADLPNNYQGDGEDMLDAFLGKEASRTKPIFWEWKGSVHGNNWPRLAVRDGDWKLVMNYDGSRKELYNIPRDREERRNVARKHPELVKTLAAKALAWHKTLPKRPAKDCISKFRE